MSAESRRPGVAIGFVGGRPSLLLLFPGLIALLLIVVRPSGDPALGAAFFATPSGQRLLLFAAVPIAGTFLVYGLRLLGSVRTIDASNRGVYLEGPRQERVIAVGAAGTRLHVTTERGQISLWLIGRGSASARAARWARRAGPFLPAAGSHIPAPSGSIAASPKAAHAPLTGSPWGWAIGGAVALGWLVAVGMRAEPDPAGASSR